MKHQKITRAKPINLNQQNLKRIRQKNVQSNELDIIETEYRDVTEISIHEKQKPHDTDLTSVNVANVAT